MFILTSDLINWTQRLLKLMPFTHPLWKMTKIMENSSPKKNQFIRRNTHILNHSSQKFPIYFRKRWMWYGIISISVDSSLHTFNTYSIMSIRRNRVFVVAPYPVPTLADNKQQKSRTITCRRIVDKYLNNGSLHGLRYIGDRSLTWFERCIAFNWDFFDGERFSYGPQKLDFILFFAESFSSSYSLWHCVSRLIAYIEHGVNGQQILLSHYPRTLHQCKLFRFQVLWTIFKSDENFWKIIFFVYICYSGDHLQHEPGQKKCRWCVSEGQRWIFHRSRYLCHWWKELSSRRIRNMAKSLWSDDKCNFFFGVPLIPSDLFERKKRHKKKSM